MNIYSNLVESVVNICQLEGEFVDREAYMFTSLKVFREELPSPKCGGLRI